MKIAISAAVVLALSQVGLAQVSITNTFFGDGGVGYKANPDEAGAVGPTSVVDFNGLDFVVHNNTTGALTFNETQPAFWAAALGVPLASAPATNDPRMVYDPITQRFYAIMADPSPGDGWLAVSQTSNPNGAWKGVELPMTPADLGMRVGYDANGLYISYYNGGGSTATEYSSLAIPIADVDNASGPLLTHVNTLAGVENSTYTATDPNASKAANAPEVLMAREFSTGTSASTAAFNQIYTYKVTWSGTTATLSTVQTATLPTTYYASNASGNLAAALQPSPGNKLRGDEGAKTNSVVEYNGNVYGVSGATATLSSNPGILWYEVNPTTGALVQSGFLDSPTFSYIIPSMAVDSQGDIGISCTETSATTDPSTVVFAHLASGAAGTFTTPLVSVAGTTYYRDAAVGSNPLAWGNYSTMTIDPNNPNLFWTSEEYAGSSVDSHWTTAWTAFTVVPEPTSFSLLALGGVGLLGRRRTRKQ